MFYRYIKYHLWITTINIYYSNLKFLVHCAHYIIFEKHS